MKALVADGAGSASIQDVEDPPVRSDYIKIRVKAVALNPTDYKHVFHFTKGGEIVGIDIAGIVEEIGSAVKSQVKIGDRVSGMVHGCNSYSPRDGGFAERAELKDGIFAHIPDSWTWSQAATLSGGTVTAGQGLFQGLGLPTPDKPSAEPIPVLIYGGSTATGCLAIQFAKLANLHVITLASPNQFERLRSLGADVCYDYHTPNIGQQINRDFDNKLLYAYDIMTNDSSMKICADALASEPVNGQIPKVSLLLPGHTFPRTDVEIHLTSGYSVLGETSIKYGNVVAGDPADYAWGVHFFQVVNGLIRDGKLRTHEIEERSGGLAGVVQGLHDLEHGRVKGHKLVYPL